MDPPGSVQCAEFRMLDSPEPARDSFGGRALVNVSVAIATILRPGDVLKHLTLFFVEVGPPLLVQNNLGALGDLRYTPIATHVVICSACVDAPACRIRVLRLYLDIVGELLHRQCRGCARSGLFDCRDQGLLFLNPGNDGIDLGSSRATVYGCEIRGAGDKGVSVGEGSLIDLQLPFIAHSQVGIAAKDESTVRITDATLIGNATAIAAYVKKPTFAPPILPLQL